MVRCTNKYKEETIRRRTVNADSNRDISVFDTTALDISKATELKGLVF